MSIRLVVTFGLLSGCASTALTQMPQDGLLLPSHTVMVGAFDTRDSWREYWEGTLKRTNDNIGTVTTQSVIGIAGYGVTPRLTVTAALPYIHTHASLGVLHDMRGIQDFTVAAKYLLFSTRESARGDLSAFVAGSVALPVGNYSPDFLPLSIGTGGKRAAARATLHYTAPSLWFATASAAYTFCANVKLDRDAYYTNGQLYLTNDVAMPNAMDFVLSTGFARGAWRVPLTLAQQATLGGGDIRRQDMPFVSNRMNFTRGGVAVMYMPGIFHGAALHAGVSRVLAGRNVGQSTTFTSGLTYTLAMP
jgi:hypothetical protein